MIRIGACTDPSNAAMLAERGFAYIEVNFQRFALMSEEEYAAQLSVLRAAPIKAEAANGMVPGSLKVTGPDADEKKLREYAKTGFARAAEMGVETVVFGSGAVGIVGNEREGIAEQGSALGFCRQTRPALCPPIRETRQSPFSSASVARRSRSRALAAERVRIQARLPVRRRRWA